MLFFGILYYVVNLKIKINYGNKERRALHVYESKLIGFSIIALKWKKKLLKWSYTKSYYFLLRDRDGKVFGSVSEMVY